MVRYKLLFRSALNIVEINERVNSFNGYEIILDTIPDVQIQDFKFNFINSINDPFTYFRQINMDLQEDLSILFNVEIFNGGNER
jgi:hypothetical protein